MRVVAKHKNSKRPRFTIPTSAAGAMSMYQLLSPPLLFAFFLLLSKPNGLFDRNGEFTVERFERFVRWEIETIETRIAVSEHSNNHVAEIRTKYDSWVADWVLRLSR